jgi:two-component system nitrogen regulation response regulator NtrX
MLFGYESSDGSNNIGAFEKANGGSIFLDEVSELSLELQGKLLKVLVENSLSKVGSDKKIDVDLRFISSTSSDLGEKIKNQSFREDLFHRLNVVPIKIPNLNERIEDIPILAEYFSKKLSLANGLALRKFSIEALTFLQGMTWPGNIRQLRNLIERVLILGNPSEIISSDELILSEVKPQDSNDQINLISTELANMSLREAREIFERDYLILQINRFGGNISKTAAFVEMERSALHRKLKSLGINSGQKN